MWTAAAALSVAAAVLVFVAASRPGADLTSGGPQTPKLEPTRVGSVPPMSGAASVEGAGAFLARMAAFDAVRSKLVAAFASERPQPASLRRPAPDRVARGQDAPTCLTQAVYYEARGEPAEGQAAVAQVVLNRAGRTQRPADLCAVVFAGAARPGCQFSFACDRRLVGVRRDAAAWRRARQVAQAAIADPARRTDLAGVMNYHADYVHPRWASQLLRVAEIGRHVFYAAASVSPWPVDARRDPSGA